jgi:hypothetical protein
MLRFQSDAQRVLGRAAASAGPVGIDSVDLLAAMLDEPKIARIIDEVSGGTAEIRHAIASRTKEPDEEGGFTLDGQAVIEATMQRSLARQENASIEDLLVGLVTADCEARRLLKAHGITAQGLEARFGRAT